MIERRDELFQKVVHLLVENRPPDDPAYKRLMQQYGAYEVLRQLDIIQKQSAERDFLIDEPLIYRKYRQTFARFGGERRFLGRLEFEELAFENAQLMARRKFLSPAPNALPGPRERELTDLLLTNVEAWEDITPPAVPPRPEGWISARPEEYPSLVANLLTWGWQPDPERIHDLAKDLTRWQPLIPSLLRMVFDKGLLGGWPGEAASWAPYHALHLLSALRIHPAAARLLALADQENDWLSDRLPSVWALMGRQGVEPVLWGLLDDATYTDDQHGLVVAGLRSLADAYPERRAAIVKGLASRLSAPPPSNAIVNGYIVFVLNRMKAVEARETIAAAFEQGKVATNIMQPGDVDFLDIR